MMDIVIDPSLYDEDEIKAVASMFLIAVDTVEEQYGYPREMVLAAMAVAFKTAAVESRNLQRIN